LRPVASTSTSRLDPLRRSFAPFDSDASILRALRRQKGSSGDGKDVRPTCSACSPTVFTGLCFSPVFVSCVRSACSQVCADTHGKLSFALNTLQNTVKTRLKTRSKHSQNTVGQIQNTRGTHSCPAKTHSKQGQNTLFSSQNTRGLHRKSC